MSDYASRRISEAELSVMEVLWDTGAAMTAKELQSTLKDTRGWERTTVRSLLTRLAEKGFVQIRKEGRSARYIPLIARRDYLAQQSRRFVQKVCGGSLPAFAAALCDSGLTREELAQLRELLERDAL